MATAERGGATVVHFPEGALSGYAGADFESFIEFDWDGLGQATAQVAERAAQLGVWVVVGSVHRFSTNHKPHNSLCIISSSGELVERYDKRFCSGGPDEQTGDLAHYSPGDHSSVWAMHGVRCGALICYDYRYPELFRQYKSMGVDLVFHSFHAAHLSEGRLTEMRRAIGTELQRLNPAATYIYPAITMPAAITAAAASNHMWFSCPNSSARQSCWPAFFVRADGVRTGKLSRNVAGVLISTVDTDQELYDSTKSWRARAMSGVLHSGNLPEPIDQESANPLY